MTKRKASAPVYIIDSLIRRGDVDIAKRYLRDLVLRRVPRERVSAVAGLARRTNLPRLSLKLLHPVIRPARGIASATDDEKAEYAIALTRMGAVEEALALLESVSRAEHALTLFGRFAALFSQWRYGESIPIIRKYIAVPDLEEYQALVGRVNLAAALIHEERNEEAEAELAGLRRVTDRAKLHLLHGNALELSAQNALVRAQWSDARTYLEQAEKHLARAGTVLDSFFLRKWWAFFDVLKSGGGAGRLAKLRSVREAALKRGHWETVRDCDRVEAVVTGNAGLFAHVYFGTPFASFREKLVAKSPKQFTLPETYVWKLGGQGARTELIDLTSGVTRESIGLKPGQAHHRLLGALCLDFYRPVRLATLHAHLFPGECFNPSSSPGRVHAAVSRLRRWLIRAERFPLVLHENDGAYRLETEARIGIRLHRPATTEKGLSWQLQRMKNKWPKADFSRREAGELLGVPMTSVRRTLEAAREEGVLGRKGSGPSTRYFFPAE